MKEIPDAVKQATDSSAAKDELEYLLESKLPESPWKQIERLSAENRELKVALKQIALHKGHEPAKDFGHCVQIARYALYPEGVKMRSKEFYECPNCGERHNVGNPCPPIHGI